ncbi:acyltransferase family protein [Curtobacterium luteum]|uniref:acyltransferase family protein n=1 Tax=Curtobacterium luteum TaxID=33881 RepID=UPI0031F8ABFB
MVASQRSVAVDLVRVIGVVAIVAGHVWDQRHFAQAGLYTWHVPVFFLLTGYLWKSDRTTGFEIRRRARTLLVPYLSWLIIVTVVWYTVRAARGEPFDTHLLTQLPLGGNSISRPYSAFWFVTALFFAAIYMRFSERLHPALPWFVGGIGVIWCIGAPHAVAMIPESAGTAIAAVIFLAIGRSVRAARDSITRPALTGVVLLLPAWWVGWSGATATLNMKGGNLGTPVASVIVAAAISVGLLLIAEGIEQYLPQWSRTVILEIAACAIPIILLHTLSLAITERYGLPSSKWTFLIALFVPLAVAAVLRRTPARRILF